MIKIVLTCLAALLVWQGLEAEGIERLMLLSGAVVLVMLTKRCGRKLNFGKVLADKYPGADPDGAPCSGKLLHEERMCKAHAPGQNDD